MQTKPKPISLLLKAIENCCPEIVAILLNKGASLRPDGRSAVRYAKDYGDEEGIKLLTAHAVNMQKAMDLNGCRSPMSDREIYPTFSQIPSIHPYEGQ